MINQLLENVPQEYHELYLKQIAKVEQMIEDDDISYKTNIGFRLAMDNVIKEVIMGSFLGVEEEPE
ncbi:hypothetical protein D3C81_1803610 [compost metagenome]